MYVINKNDFDKELSDEEILNDSSKGWNPFAGPDDVRWPYVL